ncbi:phosphoglyceromutase [Pedobacter sp. HDW13]|uniref:alkaline phosphatase family protein n=1 Tax=unclassified Pedobacter TaxID=2628915 RepID=UPI000F599026|nr:MULTISPECIES: alkaline phosphatase family protein [unclassified Pedobacter]QIL41627.1 phosphoglyceromutase [Pedobacter sp. HDW13]RQO64769.1 phosphoglyceromutase [Pedobacter sp. KBW01]
MKKTIVLSLSILLAVGTLFAQKANQPANMIIISIDGLRWHEVFQGAEQQLITNRKYNSQDSSELARKYWSNNQPDRRAKLMPFVWNTIAKQGQLYGNREAGSLVNVKNTYWFSYPGRSENLTGYADPKVNSNDYPDNPNKNVLEFIDQQKGYKGKVVAFASWDAVARIINRNRNGLMVNNPFEDVTGNKLTEAQKLANEIQHYEPQLWGSGERWDASTYALAKSYIMAKHPKVVYLDLADTDDHAHEGKYDFYLDAAHNIDAMIGRLWTYLQNDPFYKGNTTLIVMPDHGRGEGKQWTSHGSGTPHSNDTWLMALGPKIKPMGEMKNNGQIYQNQYAKTIAGLLGFNFTSVNPIGEVIESVVK